MQFHKIPKKELINLISEMKENLFIADIGIMGELEVQLSYLPDDLSYCIEFYYFNPTPKHNNIVINPPPEQDKTEHFQYDDLHKGGIQIKLYKTIFLKRRNEKGEHISFMPDYMINIINVSKYTKEEDLKYIREMVE